jgi:homoserine dehydrogenase
MRNQVTVGLIGLGTVGTGVAKVLLENAEIITRRLGKPIVLKWIADLDITTDRGVAIPKGVLTTDAQTILDDPDVDIVIELIGGYDAAKRLILAAIEKGKHVVTANKALLAVHGEDLYEVVRQANVDLQFEASVGGGIPILRALTSGLSANHVSSITGILNGTSNYILTRMSQGNEEFSIALGHAQAKGYAEADPSFDIEGIDSAHKLAIMVNLAFGTPVNIKEVYTEGITKLTSLDVAYAQELGMTVKLLGIAKYVEGELDVRVHPTMIPQHSPLAKVDGVYNAIHLVGDAVGDIMLYGQGAGSLPTASAVVSDVMDVARNVCCEQAIRIPPTSYPFDQRIPIRVRSIEQLTCRYYLRFMVQDHTGILSKLAGVLGGHGISIASVLQKGRGEGQTVPVVIMTHRASEHSVQEALREIESLEQLISEPTTLIRIEDESD